MIALLAKGEPAETLIQHTENVKCMWVVDAERYYRM